VAEVVGVSNPVLVQVTNLMEVDFDDAQRLVASLQDEGLEVLRYKVELEEGGVPPGLYETVAIWLALRAGEAVVNEAVRVVVEWMRGRFRQDPNNRRPKRALIVLYEGDEARLSEVIELEAADAAPLRKLPQLPQDEFERYTRTMHTKQPGLYERYTRTEASEGAQKAAQRERSWWRRVFG
jgi:hypothetical protein